MAESIFDPRSSQTERSGSTFLGPYAQDRSQMPPGMVDGEVDRQEAIDLEQVGNCPRCPGLPGLTAPFDVTHDSSDDGIDERENTELPGIL